MYFSWPLIICLFFISVIIRNLLLFVPRSTQDGVAFGSLSDLGHHSSRVERVEYYLMVSFFHLYFLGGNRRAFPNKCRTYLLYLH